MRKIGRRNGATHADDASLPRTERTQRRGNSEHCLHGPLGAQYHRPVCLQFGGEWSKHHRLSPASASLFLAHMRLYRAVKLPPLRNSRWRAATGLAQDFFWFFTAFFVIG